MAAKAYKAFTEVFLSSLGKEKSCQSYIGTLRYSPMKFWVSIVGKEKLLLYPLRFSVWGLWVKLTTDRLAREKTDFSSLHIGVFTEKYDLRRQLEFGAYVPS